MLKRSFLIEFRINIIIEKVNNRGDIFKRKYRNMIGKIYLW